MYGNPTRTTTDMAFLPLLKHLGLAATAVKASQSLASGNFVNNVVFEPADGAPSWGSIYARTLQLLDGALIVSWENYPPEPPIISFPIWKSDDDGLSWYDFKNVTDDVNGWGLRWQPHFHRLENDYGDYSAGTILLAGMSVPEDLSEAWIDIYISTDEAETWSFATHVAYAPGPMTTANGDRAIWEPFFLEHEGNLICYYSDQRDENHGQKLVHTVTNDLVDWADPVDDVAESDFELRPGMTTVAEIKSSGHFIMTYEMCGLPGCPAYYKVADSPYEFASVDGIAIRENTTDVSPGSSPYVIWIPHPDRNDGTGLILMNGAGSEDVFINEDDASPDGWKAVETGMWSGHSRTLKIVEIEGEEKLLLSVGGHMSLDTDNKVAVGIIDIPTR